ncbi:Fructose-bisphosphate aldolase-like, partial [Homarus americanus]
STATTYFSYPDQALQDELRKIANAITAKGKGILAADESVSTMGKRLSDIGVENTDEHRRKYRQLLFTTDKTSSEATVARIHFRLHFSVILFPETLYQKADDGTPFIKLIKDKGIIAGIKVDKGVVPLMGSEGESTTQGLDDLSQRCAQYKKDVALCPGGKNTPSYQGMLENANVLARYASICQMNGLVPIVEPERLSLLLSTRLLMTYVFLEGTLLKPNMVTAGQSCAKKYTPEEVAKVELPWLPSPRTMPAAVPGVTFLSGGHVLLQNNLGHLPSAMVALQASVLRAWGGKDEQVKAGQEELLKRAKADSEAAQGIYQWACKGYAGDAGLFIKDHAY